MFIFPPLAVFQLTDRRRLSCTNLPLIGTVMFGVSVSLIGFGLVVYNSIFGDFCTHGEEPGYCLQPNASWQSIDVTVPDLIRSNITF